MVFLKKQKLSEPLPSSEYLWQGNKELLQELRSAWSTLGGGDRPMVPVILSEGTMKYSLAVTCSTRYFDSGVYLQTISKDSTIEDLFYTRSDRKILSPFMSGLMQGKTTLIHPVGGVSQKVFSCLTPLFMRKAYIPSIESGKNISVPSSFRLAVLMHPKEFDYSLAEEFYQLLVPRLHVNCQKDSDLKRVLTDGKDYYNEEVLDYLISFMKQNKEIISIEDGKNILHFSSRIYLNEKITSKEAIDKAIKLVRVKGKISMSNSFTSIG